MSVVLNKAITTQNVRSILDVVGTGVANTVINVLQLTLEAGTHQVGYTVQTGQPGAFVLGTFVTDGDSTPLVLTGSNDPAVLSVDLNKWKTITTGGNSSASTIVTTTVQKEIFLAIAVNSSTTGVLLDINISASTLSPSSTNFWSIKLD